MPKPGIPTLVLLPNDVQRRPVPGTRQAGKTRQQRRLLGNRPTNPGFGFGPTQGTLPTFRKGRVSGTRDEDEDGPEEAEKTESSATRD